jgi:hypothetical protein
MSVELDYKAITEKRQVVNQMIMQKFFSTFTEGENAPGKNVRSRFYLDTLNSRLYVKIGKVYKYVELL